MLSNPKPTGNPIRDWRVVAAEMRRRYQRGYSFCVDAGDVLADEAESLKKQVKEYESLWCVRMYLWLKNLWRQ